MNKLICKLFGHKWKEIKPSYLLTRKCSVCNRTEVYGHMSYTIGWKWVEIDN